MDHISVGVLYGGQSAEHDVSMMSAANVMKAMDRARYRVVPIAIGRDGCWWLHDDHESASVPQPGSGVQVALVPGGKGRLVAVDAAAAGALALPHLDLLFPVLHGRFGEDGTVQGYAETAGLAYAGCNLFGSAAAMDKVMAKRLLREAGVPVARALTLSEPDAPGADALEAQFGYPFFVKPARQGSSFGVSRVDGRQAVAPALAKAFEFDGKVLVEEFLKGREIECAVLEHADGQLTVSPPGEIVTSARHDFYNYEAKYFDPDGALIVIPAKVSDDIVEEAKALAAKAFRALGCDGLARVDFFLLDDGRLLVNEVNTMPGCTNRSMYPLALETCSIGYSAWIDIAIAYGLKRG
ncbi:D-alanine--D-alanine ligase family protein [Rhizobium sp. SSA_523]|uniref:D-alanine--D-alanine ligase family protein n=1 Tax=Rhizobium sp. SSA_523 TaxID=2952477 RepID=UPI0020906CCD|nr:D-alanine--D-alanine ligase family protein [Rhizobium sp. SSA_523]MCO5730048.1 D-alanine--D-alanine ligase [Rhizobium sp. SSA_523]WKC25115.1 D-alanine--D-alanine ligase family protein [Rhizobium sp. SSA_523]